MLTTNKHYIGFVIFVLLVILLYFNIHQNIFFWDTIQLGSKHAHFYFENNFSQLLLPEQIDSGHPPGFGIYLAAWWRIFGKSLIVSHWAMFPFILGIGWLLLQLGAFFLNEQKAFWLLIICFADPVLAGQSILISPDLIVVFAFLLGVHAIIREKPLVLMMASSLLVLISMRGMMVVVILFLSRLFYKNESPLGFKKIINHSLPFIPSGLVAAAFLLYHYLQTGWIGYHPDSPWAPSFQTVDFAGLLKNIAIYTWRMLDFGRIFLWLILICGIWWVWRKRTFKWSPPIRLAAILFTLTLFLLSITFLRYIGLQGHRYLLPIFISFNCLFVSFIFHQEGIKYKNWLLGFAMLAYLGGNLWIYPDKISQGWDSTLAHWPYYELRREMLAFFEEENIELNQIGTAFPEIGPLKFKDLSSRIEGMVSKDLKEQQFILYSNVMNDFTDEEIDELKTNWIPIKTISRRGVKMVFYEKE